MATAEHSMDCVAYREIVAADVDGTLSGDEQPVVERHVRTCPGCASLRRQHQTVKTLVRERAARHATPAALQQRIVAALDAAEPAILPPASYRRWLTPVRLILVGAVAALALLVLRPLWQPSEPTLLATIAHDVRAAEAQQVTLQIATTDIEELRRFYRTSGRIDFERSADDFSIYGFHLVGGSVVDFGHVPTTFTVYESGIGKLVCRRFRAGAIRLPEGGERIGDVRIFTIEGVTVVVIPMGDVTCLLASTMPADEFKRHLLSRHT